MALTAEQAAATVERDQNGNANVPFMTPASSEQPTFKKEMEETKAAVQKQEVAKQSAAATSTHIKFDLRKVIAARLRGEAGADMARAAATEARIKSDEYASIQAAEKAKKIELAMVTKKDKGAEAQVATQAEAETAAEEAAVANAALEEGNVAAQVAVAETKKLVAEEVKKQAAAAAKAQAESTAYIRAWDKPKNWGKTLAARAAYPYLKAMSGAVLRVSEYEDFAKGMLGQAKAAQNQAQTLNLHVQQFVAQGDTLGAATEENKVKLLLGKAKMLETEANKFWNIADETRKTIPEFQNGGRMAAARAAWEFKVSFTPPPEEE